MNVLQIVTSLAILVANVILVRAEFDHFNPPHHPTTTEFGQHHGGVHHGHQQHQEIAADHQYHNLHKSDEPVHHQHLHHEHHEEHYHEPNYKFEYKVDDHKTGDHKMHKEMRKGDEVNGYYALKEADGTTREVHYTSNKHSGFNAVVTKSGEPNQELNHHHEHQDHGEHGAAGVSSSSTSEVTGDGHHHERHELVQHHYQKQHHVEEQPQQHHHVIHHKEEEVYSSQQPPHVSHEPVEFPHQHQKLPEFNKVDTGLPVHHHHVTPQLHHHEFVHEPAAKPELIHHQEHHHHHQLPNISPTFAKHENTEPTITIHHHEQPEHELQHHAFNDFSGSAGKFEQQQEQHIVPVEHHQFTHEPASFFHSSGSAPVPAVTRAKNQYHQAALNKFGRSYKVYE